MFPIAGQTAGPNGLTFFEGTNGYLGVTFVFFKKKIFSKNRNKKNYSTVKRPSASFT